jgi:hypothetical protein
VKKPDFTAITDQPFPLEYTDLPCLHLSVAPTKEMTWHSWKELVGRAAVILQPVEEYLPHIVSHFFGNALAIENAGWRIEWNSPNAARRQTVHFHLEVAHKDLWGEDGKIRLCTESLLRPKWLEARGAQLLQQNLDYQEGRRDLGDDIARMDPLDKK